MKYLKIRMDPDNREKNIRISILMENCGEWTLAPVGKQLKAGQWETLEVSPEIETLELIK